MGFCLAFLEATNVKDAKLHWFRSDEGGRVTLPVCEGEPPYATVVRFKDSVEPWPQNVVWSLVVEKIEVLENEYDWVVRVRYLFPEAPSAELKSGREFELMEGGRLVAEGVLL
jgi:hypothetical protein